MSRNYRPSYAPSVGQPLSTRSSGSAFGFNSGGSGGSGASGSGSGAVPLPLRSARESMFPVPSGEYINSLEECVRATEGCVSSLSSALNRLEPGIADFPRLTRIFEIQYGYLLIPEPRVHAKKNEYAASLQPYIDQLLQRAAALVAAEAAAVARLEEQLDLLENARRSRLPAAPRLPGTFKDLDHGDEGANGAEKRHLDGIEGQKGLTLVQRRRIGLLRNKREKLEKERARLRG